MDTEVKTIERPTRLLPLKPLKIPKPAPRRLSQSWTDNLEESTSSIEPSPMEPTPSSLEKSPAIESQKSPLQKIAGFFTEPKSPTHKEGKLQKEQSVDKEKKGIRRDSIKDQLLKFKHKTGKVLEEIHERFSEDHGAAVVPLVPSPNVQDNGESEEASGSERVISPTLSVASKKTVSSAELKASLRSKIRKQAEKVVERTRGSVQLTRRLQRRLTVHNEETFTEEDVKNVDELIDKSIKIGEKFLAQQPPSSVPTDDEQYLFFTGVYTDTTCQAASAHAGVSYAPAVPSKEEDPTLFVYYEPEQSDVENRGAITADSLTRKRFPTSIWTEQFGVDALIERKYKWSLPEEENYRYLPALTAAARLATEEEKVLLHMKVMIQDLVIVNHALCSVEEGIAASLRHSYSEQLSLIDQAAEQLQELSSGDKKNAGRIERELARLQGRLENGAESLKQQWNALEASRAAQGFVLSPLRYNPVGEESPYYGILTEDCQVKEPSTLSEEIQEKFKEKNGVTVRLALYFNDILVGKTAGLNLGNYNLEFDEAFNLEVKSIPQKLHVNLLEKKQGKESLVTRIEIKIPWTSEPDQLATPFQEFNEAKEVADKMRGFLATKVQWNPPESMEREKVAESAELINEEAFSLIPPRCRLVSDEEFDNNIRWELLERRFRRSLPKTVNARPIAINSTEIDPSLMMGEEKAQLSTGFRTGIDGHRLVGTGYASRIRLKLLERRNEAERRITYEEMVKEVALPSGIGGISGLFGPADTSRKLKPMRIENTRQQVIAQSGTKLLVNMQSAINLPERKAGGLQPVVEIRFLGHSSKTTAAAGKNPNWQQCLLIPLDAEHISDLKTITDEVHIDIYDQLVAPLPKDDREPNTVHEQLLYRFIGTVRIPFSTVYCRGKIDGGLRVQVPLFITGYTVSEKPTYIKMLIALEPPLSAPKITSLAEETSEPERISQLCEQWVQQNRQQFEDRKYTAMVNDINGKNVLVCRYLRPVRPPPSLDPIVAGRKMIEKVAKVVSFIPFLSDPLLFPGYLDLWTTIDQFVSYGCGDEEEHALLLCCWLLGSRIPSHVVLGSALPDGEKAAYVLVELPEGSLLVNPSDGSCYQPDDPMCPMTSVGCVFSPDNVYGNIQPRSHPSQVKWDFTRNNDWRPLFAKPDTTIVSIQPSAISYQEVTEDSVIELRASIERELKLRFDEARPFAIPQWNLMASRQLREILNEDTWSQNIVDERFHRLRDSYNTFATAVKIPYRSLKKCVEEILRLKLHMNTDPNIQFALGVHIQPYFNNIVGCSLGLAVLVPKR